MDQKKELVGIVIPTHNRREQLLRCLRSISALTVSNYQVIVVLDGCTDGSLEAVQEQFPDSLCVEGGGSLWWSGAMNEGFKAGEALFHTGWFIESMAT